MDNKPAFSWGIVITVSIVHLVLTKVFSFCAFIHAMGSFTQNVSREMAFWNRVMWFWSPLARSCFSLESPNLALLGFLAILWSSLVGILIAGFCFQKAKDSA